MWLMGSLGVFFIERDYLIVEANVLRWPLDDHDIVYLSCVCFPRFMRGSFKRWSSNDGSNFSNGPMSVVFGLFFLHWRFRWTSVCWATNIFL